MRLAVIVPGGDALQDGGACLRALGELRGRGHRVIVVTGGAGSAFTSAPAMHTAQSAPRCSPDGDASGQADRLVFAPAGWSRQANAGSRAPEVELADALLFLPAGVRLPPEADRSIARALANSTSPWGRFDIGYCHPRGLLRLPLALAAALSNACARLTGICTREQAIFVSRGAFLALQGFTPVDPRSNRAADDAVEAEFSRRARQLGRPIVLHDRALVPATETALLPLLRGLWRRERRRLAMAAGMAPSI